MSKKIKTIAVAEIDYVGLEVTAIRSTLEYFGFRVLYIPIGRPNDFISVLNKSALYDDVEILIVCAHGEKNEIIMPKLADDVYEKKEPKNNFNAAVIKKYARLNGVGVVTTGCTLGGIEMASGFLNSGAKYFIGPSRYIDGNASLLFVQCLFYHIAKGEKIKQAFEKAKALDPETSQFIFFK